MFIEMSLGICVCVCVCHVRRRTRMDLRVKMRLFLQKYNSSLFCLSPSLSFLLFRRFITIGLSSLSLVESGELDYREGNAVGRAVKSRFPLSDGAVRFRTKIPCRRFSAWLKNQAEINSISL